MCAIIAIAAIAVVTGTLVLLESVGVLDASSEAQRRESAVEAIVSPAGTLTVAIIFASIVGALLAGLAFFVWRRSTTRGAQPAPAAAPARAERRPHDE